MKRYNPVLVLFAALTAKTFRFALMNGMTIVSPLLPTDIHLFGQEILLC
jgi:hypothetical protein